MHAEVDIKGLIEEKDAATEVTREQKGLNAVFR